MIELVNVTKYYPTRFGRHYVFRDVSLRIPEDINVGVIGPNGAGKSTLMRLLAGVDIPNQGKIIRTGRISWPIGLTPGMQANLTGRENARFVCRIYGMEASEIERSLLRIAEVAGIGRFFDMPVNTYSAGMKSRLNFAVSMAIDFDYYLFDEISAPGDKAFKQVSRAMVEERLATSRFILASHRTDELLEICDAAILIANGELRFFEDVAEALNVYGETYDPELHERQRKRRERRAARSRERQAGAEVPLPQVSDGRLSKDELRMKRLERFAAKRGLALVATATLPEQVEQASADPIEQAALPPPDTQNAPTGEHEAAAEDAVASEPISRSRVPRGAGRRMTRQSARRNQRAQGRLLRAARLKNSSPEDDGQQ